jgi:hypothetical protein
MDNALLIKPSEPATKDITVILVTVSLSIFAIMGLVGTIRLCGVSSDPKLIESAVDLIKQSPNNLQAAVQLLQVNPAVIAIVSGLTGVALGNLGSMLNNTRTSNSSSQTLSSTSTTDKSVVDKTADKSTEIK